MQNINRLLFGSGITHMEHWQFLIQKQGDRTWQSLESPNLKILEGRYRVLARSNLPNTDVEVRVTHSSTQEFPPKRRILKRSRRTNSEGLMAVIPFTLLKPGMWELRCSGDLMSDIFGKSWQYKVLVHVLPQELDGQLEKLGGGDQSENWLPGLAASQEVESNLSAHSDATDVAEPEEITLETIFGLTDLAINTRSNPEISHLPTETAAEDEDIVINQPVSPVWLKGETAEQILQNLIDLALPTNELLRSDETVEDFPASPALPLLDLTLNRESYIARWGQALTINGHVELRENRNLEGETSSPERLWGLQLEIELRSPQESKILTHVRQPLLDQVLPFTFSTSIDIPADDESKLILADIDLYGALADVEEIILLASHSFTITADVTELLAITATAKSSAADLLAKNSVSRTLPATYTEPEPSVSLDLELFNLVKTLKTFQSQPPNPLPKKPLPPVINPRVLVSTLNKSADGSWPQLPKLPVTSTNAFANSGAQPIASTALIAESPTQNVPVEKTSAMGYGPPKAIATINLEQLVIKPRRVPMLNTTLPYLRRLPALPDESEFVNSDAPEDYQQLVAIVDEVEKTPELVTGEAPLQDESVAEVVASANAEFIDQSVAQEPAPPSVELITADPPSPLLRKWMQSQGYILPEPINVEYQDEAPSQQVTPTIEADLLLNLDTEIETPGDVDVEDEAQEFSEPQTVEVDLPLNLDAEIATAENAAVEDELPAPSESPEQLPQLLPPSPVKTSSAWLAQEIVVDDIYSELEDEVTNSQPPEERQEGLSELSRPLPMIGAIIESLPIPQLYMPDGELIAGTSVRVRVELPEVSSQVVVKLWIEDYQTRALLDGPHLLTNLLPNSLGGLEVMTQISIPFGCLEIRLEAIALDIATQQESHKVTIVRTVIPPDLPTLPPDELLGM
ncbi:hypothetical protein Cylst_4268 [Cylindrospermum stagnale PCC 7417]|uniref:Uncharacterized protein n=1 Tax=Cylindrospermum stagnale PCC 7417 TaxID=56107 RepID=K9X2Q3_9NOST|nr:hypothetical protein Cylst_4268 [Cylindrospermum stagnale PCC 7417]